MTPNDAFWAKINQNQFFQSNPSFRQNPVFSVKIDQNHFFAQKPVFPAENRPKPVYRPKPSFSVKINQRHFVRPKLTKTSLFSKTPVFPAKFHQNQFFRSKLTKTIQNSSPSARSQYAVLIRDGGQPGTSPERHASGSDQSLWR